MPFENDVMKILQDAGVSVTLGTNLYFGTGAEIPNGPGPYLSGILTAGPPPIRFQQGEFVRPGMQITARAKGYATARELAYNTHRALAGVRNRTVNGTWYREVYAVQEPFDNGLDDAERVQFVFNIVAVKNPS